MKRFTEAKQARLKRTAASAAKRGGLFLDDKRPGWHKRVPLTKLRLADSCNCVLGHLEGDYVTGIDTLLGGDYLTAQELGFTTSEDMEVAFSKQDEVKIFDDIANPKGHLWGALDAAWQAEIRKRREADTAWRQQVRA